MDTTADQNVKTIPKVINRRIINQIPDDIIKNPILNQRIKSCLPSNYNFEMHKIIWRLKTSGSKRVGLQFPEGLFIFSIPISNIMREFLSPDLDVVIFGDVTYGACCIDDYTATALGCDFLIHFAHSCLVPVNQMLNGLKVMYVFVDIKFDVWHMIQTVKHNIKSDVGKIALASTIQFMSTIHYVSRELEKDGYSIEIPQSKPLSRGEILGCTAPKLSEEIQTVIFVADGRFHLEAVMIANPDIKEYFRYNPYDKQLTQEKYDFSKMIGMRQSAITQARHALDNNGTFGFILGSLGHQGSPAVFKRLQEKLNDKNPKCKSLKVVMPEISPQLLNSFKDKIDVWVQVACPRLSIDWGEGFVSKPLLTPYEMNVALNTVRGLDTTNGNILIKDDPNQSPYPMDFYTNQSLGDWTPNHKCNPDYCSCKT